MVLVMVVMSTAPVTAAITTTIVAVERKLFEVVAWVLRLQFVVEMVGGIVVVMIVGSLMV